MGAVRNFELHEAAYRAGSLDVSADRLDELALAAVDAVLDRNPHAATALIKACEDIDGPDAAGQPAQPRNPDADSGGIATELLY